MIGRVMLFNSQGFLLFLPVVYALAWALHRAPLRLQNLFMVAAGYFFYSRWDWRFCFLLFASSTIDFLLGLALQRRKSRGLLAASVVANLGILGFFKYFDFFVDSAAGLFGLHPSALRIILPVGISFYTFQSLSYTIDVYRGRMTATRDPIAFFAFVSFFPQLVAGPISRASDLLPQFLGPRRFDPVAASDGMRQLLWGFVKKMVVADNLAEHVAYAFSNAAGLDAVSLWTGAFLFSIQIYADFSGYSDIAIGTARLFGIRLAPNFAYPYFSPGIGEFWRRWHISLSSWFRDYVYIPLGGSRVGPIRRRVNVLATFLLSGLWHGANWTYVAWGGLHGLYYISLPRMGAVLTFVSVTVAWVLFRAESLREAGVYFSGMVGRGALHAVPVFPLMLCGLLLLVEAFQRSKSHGLDIGAWPKAARWLAYYGLVIVIYLAGNLQHVSFIYFQF